MDFNNIDFEFVLKGDIKVESYPDINTRSLKTKISISTNNHITAYQSWSPENLFVNNRTRKVFFISPYDFRDMLNEYNNKQSDPMFWYKPTLTIRTKNPDSVKRNKYFFIVDNIFIEEEEDPTDSKEDDGTLNSESSKFKNMVIIGDSYFTDLSKSTDGELIETVKNGEYEDSILNFSGLSYGSIDYRPPRGQSSAYSEPTLFPLNSQESKINNFPLYNHVSRFGNELKVKGIGDYGVVKQKRNFNLLLEDEGHLLMNTEGNYEIVIKNPKMITAYQNWNSKSSSYANQKRIIKKLCVSEVVNNISTFNKFLNNPNFEICNMLNYSPSTYIEIDGEPYLAVIKNMYTNHETTNNKDVYSTNIVQQLNIELDFKMMSTLSNELLFDNVPTKPTVDLSKKKHFFVNLNQLSSNDSYKNGIDPSIMNTIHTNIGWTILSMNYLSGFTNPLRFLGYLPNLHETNGNSDSLSTDQSEQESTDGVFGSDGIQQIDYNTRGDAKDHYEVVKHLKVRDFDKKMGITSIADNFLIDKKEEELANVSDLEINEIIDKSVEDITITDNLEPIVVTVEDDAFIFDNVKAAVFTFTVGETYTFDVSDETNNNNKLSFSTLPNGGPNPNNDMFSDDNLQRYDGKITFTVPDIDGPIFYYCIEKAQQDPPVDMGKDGFINVNNGDTIFNSILTPDVAVLLIGYFYTVYVSLKSVTYQYRNITYTQVAEPHFSKDYSLSSDENSTNTNNDDNHNIADKLVGALRTDDNGKYSSMVQLVENLVDICVDYYSSSSSTLSNFSKKDPSFAEIRYDLKQAIIKCAKVPLTVDNARPDTRKGKTKFNINALGNILSKNYKEEVSIFKDGCVSSIKLGYKLNLWGSYNSQSLNLSKESIGNMAEKMAVLLKEQESILSSYQLNATNYPIPIFIPLVTDYDGIGSMAKRETALSTNGYGVELSNYNVSVKNEISRGSLKNMEIPSNQAWNMFSIVTDGSSKAYKSNPGDYKKISKDSYRRLFTDKNIDEVANIISNNNVVREITTEILKKVETNLNSNYWDNYKENGGINVIDPKAIIKEIRDVTDKKMRTVTSQEEDALQFTYDERKKMNKYVSNIENAFFYNSIIENLRKVLHREGEKIFNKYFIFPQIDQDPDLTKQSKKWLNKFHDKKQRADSKEFLAKSDSFTVSTFVVPKRDENSEVVVDTNDNPVTETVEHRKYENKYSTDDPSDLTSSDKGTRPDLLPDIQKLVLDNYLTRSVSRKTQSVRVRGFGFSDERARKLMEESLHHALQKIKTIKAFENDGDPIVILHEKFNKELYEIFNKKLNDTIMSDNYIDYYKRYSGWDSEENILKLKGVLKQIAARVSSIFANCTQFAISVMSDYEIFIHNVHKNAEILKEDILLANRASVFNSYLKSDQYKNAVKVLTNDDYNYTDITKDPTSSGGKSAQEVIGKIIENSIKEALNSFKTSTQLKPADITNRMLTRVNLQKDVFKLKTDMVKNLNSKLKKLKSKDGKIVPTTFPKSALLLDFVFDHVFGTDLIPKFYTL